jgi:hypothetical protein
MDTENCSVCDEFALNLQMRLKNLLFTLLIYVYSSYIMQKSRMRPFVLQIQERAISSIKTDLHTYCLINDSISTIEPMSRDQGITE